MKKFIILFYLAFSLFHLFQIIYSQRAFFLQKYDSVYLKDHFEHSQWVLPLSKRIIGDDELYPYIGNNLVNGGSIVGFDSEVPPLGKYLIGLSIKIFENQFLFSVFFGLGSLVFFYFIARRCLGNTLDSLFAASILFLDPLFFSQFWQSTLDIYQLFFLLAHILFFTIFLQSKTSSGNRNVFYAIMSGISLGLFAQIKFPILLLLILPLESIFFISRRRFGDYLAYLIGACLAILAVNLKFFIDGNSLIDFIKFQKYVASFYLESRLVVHQEAVWQTLFMGKFPDIVTGAWINIYEWWALWPIIAVIGISMAVFSLFPRRAGILIRGLAIFLLGSLIIFTLIPIYPRYLLLILPFLYLFGVLLIQKFANKGKTFLYLLIFTAGIVNSCFFLPPKPDIFLNNFYYNLSNLYFQDLYQENISDAKKLKLTRDQFRIVANGALEGAEIKKIEVRELEKNISIFASEGSIKVKATYFAEDLGAFSQDKTIKLVKQNNQWKIVWDWDILLDGYRPGYKLVSQIIPGRRGAIIDSKGVYLAKDAESYLLSVNPEKINLEKEQAMLKTFSAYGSKPGVYFQNAYLENTLSGSVVPILTFSREIGQKEKSELLAYPGVSLTPYISRIYSASNLETLENTFYDECCTRIYSSYNYHGISGPEKELDKTLWGYSGGKILMMNDSGSVVKTVFEKEKQDGKDVILNK